MQNLDVIIGALNRVGYLHSKGLTFKATSVSHAVEHFIYLHAYGTPKEFLGANFGFRNPVSEEFSIECIRAYGGELFSRSLKHDASTDCKMNFDFGHLYDPVQRWQIYLPQHSASESAKILMSTIEEKLFPVIRRVGTLQELFELLLQDKHPCRWSYTNGAIRAAQLVSAAKQLGIEMSYLLMQLESRLEWITLGLNQDDISAARDFLESVIVHSEHSRSTLH